jgi:hypothetical protein
MKDCCNNCRFYGWNNADRVCKRHSPIIGEFGSTWPKTYQHEWCGDFEPSEHARRLAEMRPTANDSGGDSFQ